MRYYNDFFATKEEALAFKKKHGGVLYSNTPRSRTKHDYEIELYCVANLSEDYGKAHPYCVAWNGV